MLRGLPQYFFHNRNKFQLERKISGNLLFLQIYKSNDLRVSVILQRKIVKRAVDRNLIRRRLKEQIRKNYNLSGYFLFRIINKNNPLDKLIDQISLRDELQKLLSQIQIKK